MAFCTKCGKELPENGVCSCVGASGSPAATAAPEQPAATPAPTVIYVKAPPNPIVVDSIEAVKKFFSPNSPDAVVTAANSKTHVWAILASVNILLTTFAIMLTPGGLIKSMLGEFGGFVDIGEILPYGSMFGLGLAMSVISFAVLCACIKGVYAILKSDVSFVKIMNMVSAAILPATVTMGGAIIFSFFLAKISLYLIAAGILGSVLLLYAGIQKAAPFKANAFWFFVAMNVINTIILNLVGTNIIKSIFNDAVGASMGGLTNLF